jgi:hypothetical protein
VDKIVDKRAARAIPALLKTMAIFDIFSKRQKKLRGEPTDVYQYAKIPKPLRVQIVHIWRDTIGGTQDYDQGSGVKGTYKFIVDTLRREYGVFSLGADHPYFKYMSELENFLLGEQDTEKVIDAIELSFRVIDRVTRKSSYLGRYDSSERADEAIAELNTRFKEHGIGFQYVAGNVIRVDSELLHTEVVKPALTLLRRPGYAGAQAEFLKAHEHYRDGNTKEALSECLKAFESTMKSICDKRGWKYDARATSKTLIEICFKNGLIPPFWTQHFSSLRAMLESAVPTVRHRLGGHGQGSEIVDVPANLAAYTLHMTAATIVFLVEAQMALK